MKCCVECGGEEFLGFTVCCFGDKGGVKEVSMAVVRLSLIMGEKVLHGGVEPHQTETGKWLMSVTCRVVGLLRFLVKELRPSKRPWAANDKFYGFCQSNLIVHLSYLIIALVPK